MLTFKGFKVAYWFFRKIEDEENKAVNKTLWTIQYIRKDRQSLDDYLRDQAPRIRKEAIEQFGDKINITRRILNLLNIMGLPAEQKNYQLHKDK